MVASWLARCGPFSAVASAEPGNPYEIPSWCAPNSDSIAIAQHLRASPPETGRLLTDVPLMLPRSNSFHCCLFFHQEGMRAGNRGVLQAQSPSWNWASTGRCTSLPSAKRKPAPAAARWVMRRLARSPATADTFLAAESTGSSSPWGASSRITETKRCTSSPIVQLVLAIYLHAIDERCRWRCRHRRCLNSPPSRQAMYQRAGAKYALPLFGCHCSAERPTESVLSPSCDIACPSVLPVKGSSHTSLASGACCCDNVHFRAGPAKPEILYLIL